jgi:hypothetical protein
MTKQLLACVLMTAALGVACAQGSEPPADGVAAPAATPEAAAPGTTPLPASAVSASTPEAPPAAAPPPSQLAPRPGAPAAAAAASPAGNAAAQSAPVRSAAAAPSEPPPPPKPQFKEVTIPAGTDLSVTLETAVASDKNNVEDPVEGKLAKAIVIDGVTAVPAGAALAGTVTEAVRAGKVKGRASIALSFSSLTARGENHRIRTARIARTAESTKGQDAKKVGIGAGAGALIGAIAGGGKGAAIGTAVGAGAGTGVVMATRGDEAELPRGTTLSTTLQESITVLVPID